MHNRFDQPIQANTGEAFDERLGNPRGVYDEVVEQSESGDSGSSASEEETYDNRDDSSDGGLDEDDEEGRATLEASAEREIEGDFDRLVQGLRQRDASNQSTGVLTKDWDINIEEQDAEFLDDLRAASGIGKRRRKKKGRNAGPVLSLQVRSLIGDGNQAYVDGDLPEAIRVMQEVIRIEPRAVGAWSVLAQCYEDMKQDERALQLRIMAAHLRHDADEWDRLARQSRDLGFAQQALYCYRKVYSLDPTNVDALWDRATIAKEIGDMKTARNAFLGILRRFPHDLTVLSELRIILIDLNELNTCAQLFQDAFEHYQQLYPLGPPAPASDSSPVIDPALITVSAHQNPARGPSTGAGTAMFGSMELLVLADLYNTLGQHEKAIHVIRKGCRWLQGRSDQRYWDLCGDDREYDPIELEGRQVGDGTSGGGSLGDEAAGQGSGHIAPGRYPLDINARHRLAVARVKMGDIEEGKIHANIVLSHDVIDYAPLFGEIADAYFERELYVDAKPIYELLGADAGTSSVYVLLQTAACLRMLDELPEAAEVYEYVRKADPTNNDVKMKLAEIYELLGEPRKALDLVYEVIDSRKKKGRGIHAVGDSHREGSTSTLGPGTSTAGSSLFAEERTAKGRVGTSHTQGQPRLTHAQLRELEAGKEREVIRGYGRVKELWPKMLAGGTIVASGSREPDASQFLTEQEALEREKAEREWMVEAEKLVDTFRETRNLFLTSRNNPFRGMFPRRASRKQKKQAEDDEAAQEERMASRLALEMEHDSMVKRHTKPESVQVFRGVDFKDWLRVIMQYAFILTQRDQFELAEEVLRHILVSNAYQSQQRQETIRIALISCAIYARKFNIVVEQSRKLITGNQFNNEPLRILLASLSSGLRPTDAFITSTLQKHLFREMRLADMAVKNPGALKWNPSSRRVVPVSMSFGSKGKGRGKNKKYPKVTGSVKGKEKAVVGDEDEDEDGYGDEDAEGDEDYGDGEDYEMSVDVPAISVSSQRMKEIGREKEKGKEKEKETGLDPTIDLPKKENPVVVAIYGQICAAARSYQSAIFYLLHAYDYCPDDPMICLCLAIASLGRAMQRQADNRHHLITQALAFLSRYRLLRTTITPEDTRHVGEVEYNFGRAFHQLGLLTHAVKHYERVLDMGESTGVARETAYNLSLIYVTTGAVPLAEALYRCWLSI